METWQKTLKDRLAAETAHGPINYAQYVQTVLYTPGVGYYKRPRSRVGRSENTDFYTAESLGSVFARLVIAAVPKLLGPTAKLDRYTFVEIGAEPGRSLLETVSHPFAANQVIREGNPIKIPRHAVVFANEWLDALPFHRIIFHDSQWRERGVSLNSHGELIEVLLPDLSDPVKQIADRLPVGAADGYQIDLPLPAEAAFKAILSQEWSGLLLCFDYGRRWETVAHELPEGTSRTFQNHRMGSDLLAHPGAADITCDVIWDPLEQIAAIHGFADVAVQRQETFFMQHSAAAIEPIITAARGTFSTERHTLMELLHPGNMGHRFQVLHAIR